jgi:hypothetical protein
VRSVNTANTNAPSRICTRETTLRARVFSGDELGSHENCLGSIIRTAKLQNEEVNMLHYARNIEW